LPFKETPLQSDIGEPIKPFLEDEKPLIKPETICLQSKIKLAAQSEERVSNAIDKTTMQQANTAIASEPLHTPRSH
jgi:hypothetical protein